MEHAVEEHKGGRVVEGGGGKVKPIVVVDVGEEVEEVEGMVAYECVESLRGI